MTETSISLLSIVFGILGAISVFIFRKHHSFSFTGNVIIGVFASVFIVKSFGRLGFDPLSIMVHNEVDIVKLIINLFISVLSGYIGVLLAKKIALKLT